MVTHLELAEQAGVTWFDYQAETYDAEAAQEGPAQKALLFYRTGAGKTLTALTLLRLWGHTEALVITTPSTYDSWKATAETLSMTVTCVSHQKFRMKDYKVSRTMAVVADEFHQFGGHGGQGWVKLDRLARGIQAPMVLASATPNYNDAERVYCIQHILDPQSVKGGFIEFLYQHCKTKQNPFGRIPLVEGFLRYDSAAEYLQQLEHVHYVPDEVDYEIQDLRLFRQLPSDFTRYNFSLRKKRIMASSIEIAHAIVAHNLLTFEGHFRPSVLDEIEEILARCSGATILYCDHSSIAEALAARYEMEGINCRLVTGKISLKLKQQYIQEFRSGDVDVLIGTASLATGTDGLDKVCDTLIIVDDTNDDAKRRQLIGRIMPRGVDSDASMKQVHRIVFTP